MALQVKRLTVPPAGIDVVDITLNETYRIEGVGEDTVLLKGELEARRGAPLLVHGETKASWETSTVIAEFTNLSVTGESKLFGPVRVSLDRSIPSFGSVTAGKCAAMMSLRIAMPKLGLVLHSAEPVQLQSQVETVPPIGDERTESVGTVELIDMSTKRARGVMVKAVVAWRELTHQSELKTI